MKNLAVKLISSAFIILNFTEAPFANARINKSILLTTAARMSLPSAFGPSHYFFITKYLLFD
jgi:hypothetical protein